MTPLVSLATDQRRQHRRKRRSDVSATNPGPYEAEAARRSVTAADEGLAPLEAPPAPTAAERQVADLIQIETDPETARAVLDRVPLWFHTFSLDGSSELYTPGVARDHRYRIPALPEDFSGMSVLDIGTFDGFYAFLAEARGARRVVAVDNEQYREWVSSRWGVELEGGEGFAAIRELLHSEVEYRRLDAFDLDELDETFDLILCFGILHRVANPLGLLKIFGGASRSADGCCSRPTGRRIGPSIPRRRFTSSRRERSMPMMTSSTGASPPRVWTRWPTMRASRLRADRRTGDRRPSAGYRGAALRPARLIADSRRRAPVRSREQNTCFAGR